MFHTFNIIKCLFFLNLQGLKFVGLPSANTIGKIYTLDMNDSRMKPGELRMPRNFDLESFNPHGISVYVDPSGKSTQFLCVVAHKSLKDDTFRENTPVLGLSTAFCKNLIQIKQHLYSSRCTLKENLNHIKGTCIPITYSLLMCGLVFLAGFHQKNQKMLKSLW